MNCFMPCSHLRISHSLLTKSARRTKTFIHIYLHNMAHGSHQPTCTCTLLLMKLVYSGGPSEISPLHCDWHAASGNLLRQNTVLGRRADSCSLPGFPANFEFRQPIPLLFPPNSQVWTCNYIRRGAKLCFSLKLHFFSSFTWEVHGGLCRLIFLVFIFLTCSLWARSAHRLIS